MFDNGGVLVESIDQLPQLQGEVIYLDFETTSCNSKLKSINPWHNCWIAGIAIATDDSPAYYIPIGHHYYENLDFNKVDTWFHKTMRGRTWVNHNIKYDAHVAANCLDYFHDGPLIDTLTLSKIHNSDMLSHSLDRVAKQFLNIDISRYEQALKPYLKKNHDYGMIPPSVLGPYACEDVYTVRRIYKFLVQNRPEQVKRIWDIETSLTPILLEMERTGVCVDVNELKSVEFAIHNKLSQLDEQLEQLVGYAIRANVNEDCFQVLCGKFGLPVLGWTESNNPSFDADTLKQYLVYPNAPTSIINLMLDHRHWGTILSLFVIPYQELQLDGILHGDINQCVRTGRMSMRKPNLQQVSTEGKSLIHPPEGHVFLSWDYSQIEYRTMMHYIKNAAAIKAYHDDPDMDFHIWVANMCGVERKPAKTINFLMGFGGGKKKLLAALMQEVSLMKSIKDDVGGNIPLFKARCKAKAESVYDKYHETLPSLKPTSRRAAQVAYSRGYVFNEYGRRRHIARERSHIAFNTLNQSLAADIMKDRLVAVARQFKGTSLKPVLVVHDELLCIAPIDEAESYIEPVSRILESPEVELRVPVKTKCKVLTTSWAK